MRHLSKIKLCFVWHMHQPLYKDLAAGEYKLPWTRLHALKDYFGMVKILEDYPAIHQTFNLVPSLIQQIEEYASGEARDPFLDAALKPAEECTDDEQEFILRYFFQANEERVISRYPRYRELLGVMKQNEHNASRARPFFNNRMLRDLQVLSQLAWFDEYYIEQDEEIRLLARKGSNYTLDDQQIMGRRQQHALKAVLPVYREFAQRGQIELSTSAFYHPILPLLCDSNIAQESHPYLALPNQFARVQDAREQLRLAREFMEAKFGFQPAGLWPSEGSVSDETLRLAAEAGFRWTASDDGVLARTLGSSAGGPAVPSSTHAYHAYRWAQRGAGIDVIFRDHHLSDCIGFVYARMDPSEAAIHFLEEVRLRAAPILSSGREALVPIILDGENAWESYRASGRPFLRELYQRISEDPGIDAMTVSEALAGGERRELNHIFPGSWIDANFDIWIGAEEDNRAWEYLREACEAFDRICATEPVNREVRAAAFNELLIAEGSDWCWWYGPEHDSSNKAEFDQLFRSHVANAYRLLGQEPPAYLQQPILVAAKRVLHEQPEGLIEPVIDGRITSPTEWAHAGRVTADPKSGAMHSQRSVLQDLYYGTNGTDLFFRVDPADPSSSGIPFELRFALRSPHSDTLEVRVRSEGDSYIDPSFPSGAVDAMMKELCEMRVSIAALGIRPGERLFVSVTAFRESLPIARIPANGELEVGSGVMAMSAF